MVTRRNRLASFLTALVDGAWYLTLIGIVLGFCFLAVSPWVDPPRVQVGLAMPVAFSLDATTHRVTAPSLGVDEARIQGINGSLWFSPRSSATVAGSLLVYIAVLAFGAAVLWQLRALFRTLRDGQPFVPANAARIRRVAWALILGEIVRAMLAYLSSDFALTHFTADGLRFEARPDVHVTTIVCGMIVLVIAEVFRVGTRLDEDQSLTV